MDLFISDLHLDDSRPQICELLLRYLAGPARDAERLFILGDLFEFWIGDDYPNPLADQVAAGLADLKASGTRLFFMPGNRDFLVGADYCGRAGLEPLAEPVTVTLGHQSAVLCHGDALCTGDEAYQAFRAKVRAPGWIEAFLAQPLAQRLEFARYAREESARQNAGKAAEIMDVTPSEVVRLLREQGVDLLIHGHTHRPGLHDVDVDGRSCQRVVLGDWYEQGSVLVFDHDRLTLQQLEHQPPHC